MVVKDFMKLKKRSHKRLQIQFDDAIHNSQDPRQSIGAFRRRFFLGFFRHFYAVEFSSSSWDIKLM